MQLGSVIVIKCCQWVWSTFDNLQITEILRELDRTSFIEGHLKLMPSECSQGSAKWAPGLDGFLYQATLLLTWVYFNPALISNHMTGKVCGEITYPFPNFSGCTLEVWECISKFTTHFIMDVTTWPVARLSVADRCYFSLFVMQIHMHTYVYPHSTTHTPHPPPLTHTDTQPTPTPQPLPTHTHTHTYNQQPTPPHCQVNTTHQDIRSWYLEHLLWSWSQVNATE